MDYPDYCSMVAKLDFDVFKWLISFKPHHLQTFANPDEVHQNSTPRMLATLGVHQMLLKVRLNHTFKMKFAIVIVAALAVAASARSPLKGRLVPDGRIVGGENAGEREFPFQVSIQYGVPGNSIHMCGGAIYDAHHIITAAHCVKDFDKRYLYVIAGSHNLVEFGSESQLGTVSETTFHEAYDEDLIDNDIGIITLSNELIFTAYVQPIRVALKGLDATGDVVNSGWGNMDSAGGEDIPNILQKVTLQVLDRDTCRSRYSGINGITESMVCAQSNGKGACNGDSGGPLVAKDEMRRPYLAGVVSWGMVPCAQPAYPSVYTNVGGAVVNSWLQKELGF